MLNKAAGQKDLVKAGITIVLGLVILAVFIIAFGGHRFWESLHTYNVRFGSVKNLTVGRPVKYAGIEVGRVLDMSVDESDPAFVLVELGLDDAFVVYEGTVATISQKGIVGDNFVLLSIEGDAGRPVPENSYLPSAPSNDFLDAAASMAELSGNLLPYLTDIAASLAELLRSDNRRQIEDVLKNVNSVLTQTDDAMRQLTGEFLVVAKEAREGVKETRVLVKELRTNTGSALKHVDEAVVGLHKESAETLGVLRAQVATLGASLSSLTKQLEGDLDYDQQQLEEILENTAELTYNLKLLSRSLKERPWQILYRPDDATRE